MTTNFQTGSQFLPFRPLLGDNFGHWPHQRIELQRNPHKNLTTALVRKSLVGKGGVATYKIDFEKGITDA